MSVLIEQPPVVRARRTPAVVRLLVLATFVVILNETIMINAIPRLMGDFRVDAGAAQWLGQLTPAGSTVHPAGPEHRRVLPCCMPAASFP